MTPGEISAMTVARKFESPRAEPFNCFKEFFTKKEGYAAMPKRRREFMKSLMKLLMEHSYLRDQMAGIPNPVVDAIVAAESKCPITRIKNFFRRGRKPVPSEVLA